MIDPEKAKECFKRVFDGGVGSRRDAEVIVRSVFDPEGVHPEQVPSLTILCSHFYDFVGLPPRAGYQRMGAQACDCAAEALHVDPKRVTEMLTS